MASVNRRNVYSKKKHFYCSRRHLTSVLRFEKVWLFNDKHNLNLNLEDMSGFTVVLLPTS